MISREVGIVLASADFSQEVTTTVLWLNEFYGTDIRCVRLSPYRHEGRLLLDVQQVVPLPEAAELTVRLKKREAAARVAKETNRDLTKYVITTPAGETEPLPKRRAILALHAAGIPAAQLAAAVPENKLRAVSGVLDGDALWKEFQAVYQQSPERRKRGFIDYPLHEGGASWVMYANWGLNTESTLVSLLGVRPRRLLLQPRRCVSESAR